MLKDWSVTFEIWSPDDIEAGDTCNRGFVTEGATFREALQDAGGRYAHYEPDCGPRAGEKGDFRWLTNDTYEENFRTGTVEQRSLHVPERVTTESRRRIARLLGVR